MEKKLYSLPLSLDPYDKIIACINNKVFDRDYTKTPYMISVARTFTSDKIQYPIDKIQLPQNTTIIHADFSMHRSFLILVDKELPLITNAIGAAAYKTLANGHAPASRHVDNTDRQVHGVWFRKSPTYHLMEEILLRAASWIKFNPGFTFHLWTNLKDTTELNDFLSYIDPVIRSLYCPRITFHFHDEFYATIQKWILTWTPELSIDEPHSHLT